MNKKVLTLCAGLLLAGSTVAFAQTVVKGDGTSVTAATGFDWKAATTSGAKFNQFTADESSFVGNPNFPSVSPFQIKTDNGAKPITDLENANTGNSEGKYFQFVVSQAFIGTDGHNMSATSLTDGKEILTMVWVKDGNDAGHYELEIENVDNANNTPNRMILDRTLWKVTAKKLGSANTLYYTFQNKASQAIMQLGIGNTIGTANAEGTQEVKLEIVNGQTEWRWAAGEHASVPSKIESAAGNVLQGEMSAQYSEGFTIHLARVSDGTNVYLGAIKMNSNTPFAGEVRIGTKYFTPITFEAWEANPIILTAAQINAELGNEDQLTEDKQTKGSFQFEFSNDVKGFENVMKGIDFVAEGADDGYQRLPGDTPDGYVRFKQKNTNKYLRVDTAYYDSNSNAQYALQMKVDQILPPRGAVAYDDANVAGGLTVKSDGSLSVNNNTLYASGSTYSTPRVIAQLKRQSNFRPIFYPSTQSLRLQAEMIYRADKRINTPWWQQMAQDAMTAIDSDQPLATTLTPSNAYMRIADYAKDPDGTNPQTNPSVVRGYYPSYVMIGDAQGVRLIHYKNAWKPFEAADAEARSGYSAHGAIDYVSSANKMLWNAVGNVLQAKPAAKVATANSEWSTYRNSDANVWVVDPGYAGRVTGNLETLSTTPNEVTSATTNNPLTFAPQYAMAYSNLVQITTLASNQRALTADIHDANDSEFNGLNTYISLKTTKIESGLEEVADIQEGFYYIRNARTQNSDLVKVDDYRYEDLAATNATFAYWNAEDQKWDRGNAPASMDGAKETGNYLNTTLGKNEGINEDYHKTDRANIGNLVYSSDKKVIPSAQWYIKGNGGYYTIINRESGREWGTSYWWKVEGQDGVYANLSTYTDASGNHQYRDTIRIEAIPSNELIDEHLGYLYMGIEEAKADTSMYNVGMSMAGATFSLVEGEDGNLIISQAEGAKGNYKLERVLISDKDKYSQAVKDTTDFYYGYVPTVNGEEVENQKLVRAMYYIYEDDVNANTGEESTGIMTRKYITLDGGNYKLTPVKVKAYKSSTANAEVDESANPNSPKTRRAFYIKQMSSEDPTQFVLVDPEVVSQMHNGTSTKTAYGAHLFVNQISAEVEPNSLISDGTNNAYASGIFSVTSGRAYNYVDIRPAGVDRDTVEFYATKTDGQYLLSENNNVTGAHVGLLESLDQRLNKNNALFLDTANVQNPEFPRFYLGLRSKDSCEVSNLTDPDHNKHLFTDADYLVNMVDSAANNSAYVYKNQAFNETESYRLGFVRARHYADGSLKFLESGNTYSALGKNDLNKASFAFRYANADRNPNEFYIETMYNDTKKGWLATVNHVLVVTDNIQQAEVFSVNTEVADAPTANETIAAEGAVSVVATDGAVVIKGAEGKNVVIATILGKVVANETINSDNETIAVPAGIAVVSVDGESFKVVVK